jgi:hypothetical protein
MKTNPLAEEILKHLRQDDDPFDSGELPEIFDALFEFRPSTGRGNNSLVKSAETQSLLQDMLGADIEDVTVASRALRKNLAVSASEKWISEIASQAAHNYMAKAVSVTAGATLRKRVIAGRIIEPFKKALGDKGYATAWDGWERLQSSMENTVTEVLMAA